MVRMKQGNITLPNDSVKVTAKELIELKKTFENVTKTFSIYSEDSWSRWGEGSKDGTRMAKRFTKEDQGAYRGVFLEQNSKTQEFRTRYVGPYVTSGAASGILTSEINAQKRSLESDYYRNPEWIIVAVKVQVSDSWKDSREWTEV